ncbi:hypothetical protein T01_6694, partial [Trichinella spiralis]
LCTLYWDAVFVLCSTYAMHVVVWSHFERFKQAFHLGRF